SYASPASFDFTVSDGSESVSGTMLFDVVFPNTGSPDPPVITVNTGSELATGGSVTIFNSNLKTVDPDNDITQIVYTITSTSNGTLYKGTLALSVGQTFRQADLNYGSISFTHDGSGGTAASFGFDVSDGTTTVQDTFNI